MTEHIRGPGRGPKQGSLLLIATAMLGAVVVSLPADAQSSRRNTGLIDPAYREPVYAPKRGVVAPAASKSKQASRLPQARGLARGKAAAVAAKPAASRKSAAPALAGVAAAAGAAGVSTTPTLPASVLSPPTPAPPPPAPPPPATGAAAIDPVAPSTTPTDPAVAATVVAAKPAAPVAGVPMTMEQFLDRLMIAESGGRLEAKNPRSTALGPFQFIESTFLAVAKRNFAAETANLSNEQILALRTDMAFSRKAAEAYTRENAAVLKSYDVEPTYPNLRLAFLLGAGGAAKVLKAPPLQMLQTLLSPAVLIANPFMASMTASGLAARSAREVWQPVNTTQGVTVPPGTALPRRVALPSVPVQCNIRLPSCKRWLALETAKLRAKGKGTPATKVANASRQTGQEISNTLSRLGGPKAAAPAAKR